MDQACFLYDCLNDVVIDLVSNHQTINNEHVGSVSYKTFKKVFDDDVSIYNEYIVANDMEFDIITVKFGLYDLCITSTIYIIDDTGYGLYKLDGDVPADMLNKIIAYFQEVKSLNLTINPRFFDFFKELTK